MRDSRASAFGKIPILLLANSLDSVSRRGNRTIGKIGSNSFRLKSRHRSITISTVIYEPERAATGEKLGVRTHVKSIFCHTLTRCCPNPSGIYDEPLNDRSLSRSGLCQASGFLRLRSARRVDRFVWLLAPKHNRRVPDLPSCDSAHPSDLRSCDSTCISIFRRAMLPTARSWCELWRETRRKIRRSSQSAQQCLHDLNFGNRNNYI